MKSCTRLAPIVLLFGAAAFAQDVHYNYDRSADFGKYKTYKWVAIPGGKQPDQLLDQDIRQAINQQLTEKGLTPVEQNPDLLVGYQLSFTEQQQITTWGDPTPWGWGPYWDGGGLTQSTVTTVPVGTIVVDMYDPAHKQLVWRGSATKTWEPSDNPEKNQKNLDKSMAKLLKHFPPEEKEKAAD